MECSEGRGERFLIVDGHYYAYRSYFAIPGLKNSKGKPTNAIFGFAKALQRMLEELRPVYGIVIWDGGLAAERVALVSQYKANRLDMPRELREQMDELVDLASAFGILSVCLEGVEADDLIASYARAAATEGKQVIIATNDKDLFQIVSNSIFIYTPQKRDFRLQGPQDVIEKWGVTPELLPVLLALTGDTSDNIPGVTGVGPKTAAAWIQKYRTLDNIDQHLMEIGTESQRSALAAAWDQVKKNYQMVLLQSNIPLPLSVNKLKILPDKEKQRKLFEKWEFKEIQCADSSDQNYRKPSEIRKKHNQNDLFGDQVT